MCQGGQVIQTILLNVNFNGHTFEGFYYQVLKKTSDIGGKGDHVSPSNNIVSESNASEIESQNKENKGWKAIRIRDPDRLRNPQREPDRKSVV